MISCVSTIGPWDEALYGKEWRKPYSMRAKNLSERTEFIQLKVRLKSQDMDRGGLLVTVQNVHDVAHVRKWLESEAQALGQGPLIVKRISERQLAVWVFRDTVPS